MAKNVQYDESGKAVVSSGLEDSTFENIKNIYQNNAKSMFDTKAKELQSNESRQYGVMQANQNSAMDSIRQANAGAIATGASRGMQNANMLSSILGLQSANNEQSTALAQERSQLAMERQSGMEQAVRDAYGQYSTEQQGMYASDTERAATENAANAEANAAIKTSASGQEAIAADYMKNGQFGSARSILTAIGADPAVVDSAEAQSVLDSGSVKSSTVDVKGYGGFLAMGGTNSYKPGTNISLNLKGMTESVEVGDAATGVASAIGNSYTPGTVFVYGGQLYLKTEEGTKTIQDRANTTKRFGGSTKKIIDALGK